MGIFTTGYVMHQYDKWLLTTVANIVDDDLSISSAGLLRGGAIAWVEVSVPESITTPEGVTFRPHYELARDRSQLIAQAEQQAGHLQTALSTNRTIGMAVGVLMSSQRVTSDRAFDLLRLQSNNTNRKLRDVAEEVVHTGELPATH